MTKITKNLFDLTKEEAEMSMQIYGKIIKCLIAPYHYIKTIPLEANNEVFVYPERDLNIQQRKSIVSVMANSAAPEIRFVTSDLFIILDMVQGCTRILTPDGEIVRTPEITFGANPHTIIYNVLQDDVYVEKYKDGEDKSRDTISRVITAIDKKEMTKQEYEANLKIINSIGEDIVKNSLKQMLNEVNVV